MSEERHPVTGNYFVSTYPPFFYWKTEEVAAVEPALGTALATAPSLGFYFHIPFCVQRCNYCYYLSYEGCGEKIDPYLDTLGSELTTWMSKPALAGRRPEFIYFGGGTPSILSTPQVRLLLQRIRQVAPWQEHAEVTFECAPKTLTEKKARALKDGGVTRLSLGIQQLNDDVLRGSGRIHLVADAERAYQTVRHVGFDQVNLDLMVGMPGETEATFMGSLAQVVKLAPDSITLYQTEIPHNTPLFRSIRDGHQDSAELDWAVKHDRLKRAFAYVEGNGYARRSAYTAVRDPRTVRFNYQDLQYHGADLLGLGASAFSYLGGVHHQNLASLDTYMETVASEKPPLFRAHVLTACERMIREFILQMKLGEVDLGRLSARYGESEIQHFHDTLTLHAREGWLAFDDNQVRLTLDGLARVDRLLPAYYLSLHRGSRYS